MAIIAHVSSSPFVGGPERQMLGLARHLGGSYETIFLPFAEGGRCAPFVGQVRASGFCVHALRRDKPNIPGMVGELAERLRNHAVDVVFAHQYKGNLIGLAAARMVGIPIVSVAHGWTGGASTFYEALDRIAMRFMDVVVCVSEAQARRVRRAGVHPRKITVIPNAVEPTDARRTRAEVRRELEGLFPAPPQSIVGAAGRLSFEKGFDQLVAASALTARDNPGVGFVVFGDGPERKSLELAVHSAGLDGRFVLAGFRANLADVWPALDAVALASRTEGMPVVLLEAMAAGIPVVATGVGGTPELVNDGESGYVVTDGDVGALARRMSELLDDAPLRHAMGEAGRRRVLERFNFDLQSEAYRSLFERLGIGAKAPAGGSDSPYAQPDLIGHTIGHAD